MSERNGRVLVVDDSEDDQLQLRRLLRREFDITAAYTGTEALELLERASFDALITDQKMPRMSGDALIARVKEDPRTAGLRCILLSGRTSDEQLVEILAAGRVFHYFEKHKTLLTEDGRTELILAVRNAVQASRLEQDRSRLTGRLRAQVDAVSGQYRLLRSLVDLKDPAEALRLVLDSLRQRLRCRAAIGVLDLRPEGQVLGHATFDRDDVMTRTEWVGWQMWMHDAHGRLAGRELPDDFDFTIDAEPVDGSTANAPRNDAPTIPVFVNRDLRGLLVLVRPDGAALEADERELFEVWRDQLQDALTRLYTRRLDELRRIELMVEAMTEGVVLTDEGGTVTLLNPVARQILGLGEIERPDFSVVVRALGLQSLDVLRQLGAGDTVHWREIRRGDRYLQVLFSQVRDHGGRSVGMLTVIREITSQKIADQRRDEFVHIISHELRSPLTSIGGVVDLLKKEVLGALNSRQLEYLAMAKDACARINGLVDDLLDLAKMEQGKLPMQLHPVHLEAVVRAVVRRFEAVALEKTIELTFDCLLEGLYCQADADRLGQVVSNLLSNALKFTPRGGRIRVSVFTAFAVPDLYIVSVHNSGVEIPPGSVEVIFQPYEQGSMPTPGGPRVGTGLGLSICRTIIQGHQGEIWVESGAGEGTAFLFSLPAVGPQGAAGAAEPRAAAAPTDRPVLVIADDRLEAYALKAHLLGFGFRVRVVDPEVEAVRALLDELRPIAAICVAVEGSLPRDVLAELAGRHQLAVVAMVPLGTPAPPAVDLVLELPHDTAMLQSALNVIIARQRERRRLRVLVIDRDRTWASRLAGALDAADYLAYVAEDSTTALARVDRLLPDLVVLDLALPDARSLRARLEARVEPAIPLLFTDSTGLVPPEPEDTTLDRDLDRNELLFRLRSRLASDRRPGIDSLSILPGAREVQRELQTRMRDQQPYACGLIELVGLDEGIDRLGILWGHQVLAQVAELIHQVLREWADDRAFLGHQREHDFIFLVGPEHCATVCQETRRAFERVRSMIIGRREDAPRIDLCVTAVVDTAGRFDRYASLQDRLVRLRGAVTSEPVIIDAE